MARSFGFVDTKIQESEYFLERILAADLDFFGVQCDSVAFAASTRSVTFAMQASLKGTKDFEEWYSSKQRELKENKLARFFHEFRRVSQHIGDNVVNGGSYRGGQAIYHFGSIPDIKEVPTMDVASACEEYFKMMLELVYDCYLHFNPLINGQWKYTKENFDTLGLTIEDAEESIGLPRGWSSVSGLPEEQRWFYIRKEVDGCNIQTQFERWLDKRVPHPDDENEGIEQDEGGNG